MAADPFRCHPVVSNNKLTSLPSTLTSLPSLKKISASHNLLTPSGLPNLSSLSHLHELRLSHNPSLTSLPSHFGGWGKQPLPAVADSQADAGRENQRRGRGAGAGGVAGKRQGIEILDLSSCGFENWYGLRAIAEQDGIVNLGLKGNKVASDAMSGAEGGAGGDTGFEEFKSKVRSSSPFCRGFSPRSLTRFPYSIAAYNPPAESSHPRFNSIRRETL